jgi:Flp pilus assembly protein TadG
MSRPSRWSDEKGAAMVYTAIAMTAMLAFAAVGVDIGHLAFTATEVQSAADSAATAGAHAMLRGNDAQGGAEQVMGLNRIDGHIATPDLQSVDVGNFDGTAFSTGGTPQNAVHVTAAATVSNLLGSMYGHPNSTVTKVATASFVSLAGGQPTLPLAIGDCAFPDPNCLDSSCLPSLTQVPNPTNNTAWTGFFGGTGTSDLRSFFPTSCPHGGGVDAPEVEVGDSINLNNGQTNVLDMVQCLFDAGITQFVVPVVNCGGNFNQSSEVKGFATIVIDSVVSSGNPKGINLHAIFNSEAPGKPGPAGGGSFGTGFVALVG